MTFQSIIGPFRILRSLSFRRRTPFGCYISDCLQLVDAKVTIIIIKAKGFG